MCEDKKPVDEIVDLLEEAVLSIRIEIDCNSIIINNDEKLMEDKLRYFIQECRSCLSQIEKWVNNV